MDFFDKLPRDARRFLQLREDAQAVVRRKDDDSAIPLLDQWIQVIELDRTQGHHWPFEALAKVMRRRKDFDSEIKVLDRFFANLIGPLTHRSDFILADRLQDAREEKRSYVAERGTCDRCHLSNRALRRNDGGHALCVACQRAAGAKLKKDRVPSYDRSVIQKAGLETPPDMMPVEAKRLKEIINRRHFGLPDDASQEEYLAAIRRKQFFTKVAGVTFTNPDGTSRQSIIHQCAIGERLLLVRERDNPTDSSAVRVCRSNGETIGYLGRHVASSGMGMTGVAEFLDEGMVAEVVIATITSVPGGRETILGVNIEIILSMPVRTNDSGR